VLFTNGAARGLSSNDLTNLTIENLTISGAAHTDISPPGDRFQISGNAITVMHVIDVMINRDRFGDGPMLATPITLGANVTMVVQRSIFLSSQLASGADGADSADDAAVVAEGRAEIIDPFWLDGAVNLNGRELFVTVTTPNAAVLVNRVTGAGALTKASVGLMSLIGPNTYTGVTTINGGTVILRNNSALGATGAGNETKMTAGGLVSIDQNVTIAEAFTIVPGTPVSPVHFSVRPNVTATLTGAITSQVATGIEVLSAARLDISGAISAAGQAITKTGPGILGVSHAPNTWSSLSIASGKVIAARGALADGGFIDWSPSEATALELTGDARAGRAFAINGKGALRIDAGVLTVETTDTQPSVLSGLISGSGGIRKTGRGGLSIGGTQPNTYTGTTTVDGGYLRLETPPDMSANALAGPVVVRGTGVLMQRSPTGFSFPDAIPDAMPVTVNAPGSWELNGVQETIASLSGDGLIYDTLNDSELIINGAANSTFSGSLNVKHWRKMGSGTLFLNGNNSGVDLAQIREGTVEINGVDGHAVIMFGGTALTGAGTLARSRAPSTTYMSSVLGTISPGTGRGAQPGILRMGTVELGRTENRLAARVSFQVNGAAAGSGYDQLDLTGDLIINAATLTLTRTFAARAGATFTLVNLAPFCVTFGTFDNLPEGATFTVANQPYRLTYRGGDGNDIVITALADAPGAVTPPETEQGPITPIDTKLTYNLAEGATSDFFDQDVLIANPNDQAVPITLTFSTEGGEQVTQTRTLAPQSHTTVHVDEIAGLAGKADSTRVTSESSLPLIVERSMFWDKSYYAGHTGGAVEQASPDWFFAEGSQGFFQTYVLVINSNPAPVDLTFTFFRENDTPLVQTMSVGASSRFTLDSGMIPGLVDRSFGIAVHASAPIMAERATYFGSTKARLWSGGHASAGVTAPSSRWFLAEGATGSFFDTFVLLSNPQSVAANVSLQYLFDSGETIAVAKTVPANGRLTVNVGAEDDPRLHHANVSTMVMSDVPILAERSMYWPSGQPWREGHNSFGVVDAATKWGLAEGRVGGPHAFHTYILLANPQSTAAEVTVRFLREVDAGAGAPVEGSQPIERTFTVPPTSRVTVDVNEIQELQELQEIRAPLFGAVVFVTNNVPIVVERSMYWDAGGVQFSGGSNATATRLP
jgi:autotransporter-associated beta strand protein